MGISKDVVVLLNYLLPGFVAAWVFYGLTSHPKSSPFERTVQALIFTMLIKATVISLGWMFIAIHQNTDLDFGEWSANIQLLWSVALALLLGHLISWGANANWYHKFLYDARITTKTSLVSEWQSVFVSNDTYVILHIADDFGNRRLLGWPSEWPEDPETGYFAICDAEWLIQVDDEYERQPLEMNEIMLIPSKSVKMVEFLTSNNKEHSDEESQQSIDGGAETQAIQHSKASSTTETAKGDEEECQSDLKKTIHQ